MRILSRVSILLVAGLIASGPLGGHRADARNAATISYNYAAAPGGLPGGFVAPPNAKLEFLTIEAIDGFTVDAALFREHPKSPANTTMVISVHGSGGSFLSQPIQFLAPALSAAGYAVLAINTRQSGAHNPPLGNLSDNFLEIRRDIEAAVYTARDMGYKRIVLHGQSLGNIQVQYYAANNWDHDLKAVLLTGMFAKLPWKSRHLLTQDEANYHQLFDEAIASVAAGTEDQDLDTKMGWIFPPPQAVTGRHFLTYRWDKTSVADGTYWINRIPRPILMIRGSADVVVRDFEPNMLLAAATEAGTLVPDIKFVLVDGGSHGLTGAEAETIATVLGWLSDKGL